MNLSNSSSTPSGMGLRCKDGDMAVIVGDVPGCEGNIEESGLLDRHAQRLLRSQLKLASEETQVHANEIFKSLLENEIPSN